MSKFKPGDKVVFKSTNLGNKPYHPGVIVPKEGEELTIAKNLGLIEPKFSDDFYEVEESKYFDQSFAERCLVPLQTKAEVIQQEEPEAIKLTFSKKVLEKSELLAN